MHDGDLPGWTENGDPRGQIQKMMQEQHTTSENLVTNTN